MDIRLAVVADYCNISAEGKLNVMGIFDVVHAARFPVMLPAVQLVMTLEFPVAEQNREVPVEVQLIDADGKQLWQVNSQMTPKAAQGMPPGEPVKVNHVIAINNLRFEKPGEYSFAILVRGDQKSAVRLRVNQLSDDSQGKLF